MKDWIDELVWMMTNSLPGRLFCGIISVLMGLLNAWSIWNGGEDYGWVLAYVWFSFLGLLMGRRRFLSGQQNGERYGVFRFSYMVGKYTLSAYVALLALYGAGFAYYPEETSVLLSGRPEGHSVIGLTIVGGNYVVGLLGLAFLSIYPEWRRDRDSGNGDDDPHPDFITYF